jgi:predicted nucleic-acid-binding Zn-ribbon protein
MNLSQKCPKCNGEMVRGFLIDYQNPTMTWVSTWAEGKPEKSFWFGTRAAVDKETNKIPTATFRCAGCGYLESYARPEFAPI